MKDQPGKISVATGRVSPPAQRDGADAKVTDVKISSRDLDGGNPAVSQPFPEKPEVTDPPLAVEQATCPAAPAPPAGDVSDKPN